MNDGEDQAQEEAEKQIISEWSHSEIREMILLYLDGVDLELLAHHFECSQKEALCVLSEAFFGIRKPLSDPSAPNYRKRWDWAENRRLQRLHALRTSPSEIARVMGRDELGVVYRILGSQLAVLPESVVRKYMLDESEIDPPLRESVKKCKHCLDVVIYCQCQLGESGN